jgi:hypothetical protein
MIGYNRMGGYNISLYNADGILINVILADSFVVADATITKQFSKTLSELIISSDTTAKEQNKSVNDNIKLDVWLSIDRDDSNLWGDN